MKPIKVPENYKYIALFLTMKCNLNCSFCLNAFNKDFNRTRFKEISGQQWVQALNRIESKPEVPITFSGGEPFLHKDFIYLINNLKPGLNIDILTNLYFNEEWLEKFISEVNPDRLKRDSPYASIRVSYHPEQMDAEKLVRNVKKLQNSGFSIAIYSVQHPSPESLEAITQMQFRCRDAGIDFRVKDFTGKFEGKDNKERLFSILYGDYSKYPNAAFQENTRTCLCRTSELLISSDGAVYKCHRDLYAEENSTGDITDPELEIQDIFRECNKFGHCHPCDVKLKTSYRQQLGHTSVEIKDIK